MGNSTAIFIKDMLAGDDANPKSVRYDRAKEEAIPQAEQIRLKRDGAGGPASSNSATMAVDLYTKTLGCVAR
jgi:hypothetical protein